MDISQKHFKPDLSAGDLVSVIVPKDAIGSMQYMHGEICQVVLTVRPIWFNQRPEDYKSEYLVYSEFSGWQVVLATSQETQVYVPVSWVTKLYAT